MKLSIATFLETVKTVALVILISLGIRTILVQPFVVDGASMEPNFHSSEYLLVDKLSYHLREPQRGEVVVFHPPGDKNVNYIKRVIGLPGETVEITENTISINGKVLEEKYLGQSERTLIEDNFQGDLSRILGPNEYFVLGDNRDTLVTPAKSA